MGYPNIYKRLRSVKGTRLFIVRDYFALASVAVGFTVGLALWFTPGRRLFEKQLKDGFWEDSDEMKKRTLLLHTVLIQKSSQQIRTEIEEDREFSNAIGRVSENPFN